MTVQPQRVRLYHQVRSAHLERAAELPPATILYGDKRYDFEEALAADLDLVQARGWRAARYLFTHPVGVLEVNEPLMLSASRPTALALVGVQLRQLISARRTLVVSYAIENLDPGLLPRPGRLKQRLGRWLDLVLSRAIWRRLDRVAFGTEASRDVYRSALPQREGLATTVIHALPAPQTSAAEAVDRRDRVLFLGALAERKGLPQLLRAWPLVVDRNARARLTVMGIGPLQELAEQQATHHASIDVHVDAPRAEIRRQLGRAQVLVLLSQPTPGWREQVGLPIVEGLSYGCTIVTTPETGLASWLAEHGHHVIDTSSSAAEVAEEILTALEHPIAPAEVLASLPDEDGRLAADAWLFGVGDGELSMSASS
jgi:glycosyltransferase involved in cell wall biosynthesis